ncbi:MAG TPA: biotin carboxylase N-terminal domain-containing protein, partial [Steroidobacteraceae bacterium]|nr:biotin carboxylase N-terminal domain-containing protein [Steroidobacteraceae bacterium]
SAADAGSPHVQVADEAVEIGPAAASDSYLRADRIIEAARRSAADAIHPGYGFLSERAEFAQACADAGIVFIGPPPSAIAAMGDKAGAKRRMLAAGVPCAPGYLGDDQDDGRLLAEGAKLGVPLLVKAIAGGGGRGMRLVRSLDEMPAAIAGARREALSAFGDGALMLERLIEGGRHIEIQVFADRHGNAIHLGERDCTTQRRRQKVVEEAPSPIVDAAMRARMGADAVAAARAVGYVGAGTVEFIVDARLQHYFLEMNTRLQVEHPVTESICGLDLVEWQLRVAAGEPLPLAQEDVRFTGHAIEARLYAEDPYAGFAPQTGRILHWRPERAEARAVRVDSGIAEGGTVSPYYDAMVAKVVAHGRDRADAARRLATAVEDAVLVGVKNNGRFLRDLLSHPDFTASRMDTGTLDRWSESGEPVLQAPAIPETVWRLAAAVLATRNGTGWRPASVASYDLELIGGDERRNLRVRAQARSVDVTSHDATSSIEILSWRDHDLRYAEGGRMHTTVCVLEDDALHIASDGAVFTIREVSPWPSRDANADPRYARAPVAGAVAAISVAPGDRVESGQPLVCVEAMKMEMWLTARSAGTVRAVHVEIKQSVEAGVLLVEIETEGTE